MPIKIDDNIPARQTLESENIFVMSQKRADQQDIRPLKLIILNLMPTKVATETQLLRCLSNTPIQIEVEFLQTSTYKPKNTPEEHLIAFYKNFHQIRDKRYDGLIITGAPVENLPFEEVEYWDELCEIMQWSTQNVYSTFHICWGAQAALYYHYGIHKYKLDKKYFGVFEHNVLSKNCPLVRGFDDTFRVPHSRHTDVRAEDIARHPELELLSTSPQVGVYLAMRNDGRQIFATGHAEYDAETLSLEYFRDVERGLENVDIPVDYFPENDPSCKPTKTWRSHTYLLFSNWLNYYVYQGTPFDLQEL